MSWGVGYEDGSNVAYGNQDAWAGPLNGIDVEEHISGAADAVKKWTAVLILIALGLLWFLGGFVFKSARIH